MAITTASQSQLGQETAKNSQIVTQSVKLVNSGGGAAVGPNITSIIVTDSGYNTLDDTAAATSNSYIKIIGTGFQSTANVFLNGTMVPTANVTFISSTELRAVLPVSNTGNYAVSVYNSNSSGALYSSSFVISTMPQWLTSATLADVTTNTAFSNTLSATSDSNITYSNTTALPAGTTLLSNGYFYGSISSANTYSFNVKATDAENQDSTRTFNLTTVSTFTLDYLVVAGGGGGGSRYGGGGGAGGMRTGSLTGVLRGNTYTITIGAGGNGNITTGTRLSGANGSNSVFGTVYTSGGGGGGGEPIAGYSGGSGGGASTSGAALYPGGPGNKGGYTPVEGYPGGAMIEINFLAGGGGGAGGAGNGSISPVSPGTPAFPGGPGAYSTITGANTAYAGGGGGGNAGEGISPTAPGGTGGVGGGGNGAGGPGGSSDGSAGTVNTGGGGGGGSLQKGGYNGGSGLVILSIPTPAYPGSAPGATVTTPPAAPGKTIVTFTSSGTYTA